MKNDERRVYFYDVEAMPRSKRVVPPKSKILIDIIDQSYLDSDVTHYVENNNRFLTITDRSEETDWFIYYVKSSDKRGAESSYTDFPTNSVTRHKKTSKQGRDAGAHVLISKTPDPVAGSHLVLIEKNSGIQRAHISSLFKKIIRSAYKTYPNLFLFPDASGARDSNGNPELIKSQIIFSLSGHPSDSFKTALTGNSFLEIEMVNLDPKTTMGGSSWLDPVEERVKFKPTSSPTLGSIFKNVEAFVKGKSRDFDSARIKFDDPESEKPETFQMATDGTILTEKFLRSVWVDKISPPMPDCCDGVHAGFVRKLKAKL